MPHSPTNCPGRQACADLYAGWLDYDAPYTGWVQRASTRNNQDNYRTAARERAALVKQQLDGIADKCRRNGCNHPMTGETSEQFSDVGR